MGIAGIWQLISVEHFLDDGTVDLPFGPEPKGYIGYTPGGYMFSVLMEDGRPNITAGSLLAGDVDTAPTEELLSAFHSASGFAGRYEPAGEGRITNHLEVATYPNWTNTSQERPYELDGDDLSMYPPGWRVRYRRVESL